MSGDPKFYFHLLKSLSLNRFTFLIKTWKSSHNLALLWVICFPKAMRRKNPTNSNFAGFMQVLQ